MTEINVPETRERVLTIIREVFQVVEWILVIALIQLGAIKFSSRALDILAFVLLILVAFYMTARVAATGFHLPAPKSKAGWAVHLVIAAAFGAVSGIALQRFVEMMAKASS